MPRSLSPDGDSHPSIHGAMQDLLASGSAAARIATVEAILRSPAGPFLRLEMGKWIVEHLPVEHLVPEAYSRWRPLVRDAMLFMVQNLSAGRLAPKLIQQVELPPNTRTEVRLLHLISKVPGLQKLGQVLARNRHLIPSL